VKEYLQGARLLDIGAGTGRVASRVAMDGVSRVICLDPSMPMLSQIGRESPGDPGKLLPVAGLSMETLPFLTGSSTMFTALACFPTLRTGSMSSSLWLLL